MKQLTEEELLPEFVFKASRSGGKGGQNVNKVSTKVQINFNIVGSRILSDIEKELLLEKYAARINGEGDLQVVVQKERSQLGNKELAIKKMIALINKAFEVEKKRKATRPSKSSVEVRLSDKKKEGVKKRERRGDSSREEE